MIRSTCISKSLMFCFDDVQSDSIFNIFAPIKLKPHKDIDIDIESSTAGMQHVQTRAKSSTVGPRKGQTAAQ